MRLRTPISTRTYPLVPYTTHCRSSGAAARVEIDRQRHRRHPLAGDSAVQLVDLAFVEQRLARALGLVVEAVAVAELGDVRVDEPHLLTLHLGIALGDRSFAEEQALHLGARHRDPRSEERRARKNEVSPCESRWSPP